MGLCSLFFAVLAGACGDSTPPPPSQSLALSPLQVVVEAGLLQGVPAADESAIRVFRGIPYAAAPVGALRWRPPEPAQPWQGVRTAYEFGPACPQQAGQDSTVVLSEDCLFLNIWTPAMPDGDKAPVMVWIHGGGLNLGFSHREFYDGRAFAERGVVLVTINYRLGPLGFLAHPELSAESEQHVSGNYGFLDQIEALQWVQRNIAAFGGDPDNVTIFGESAGGTSIAVLATSPLADKLFAKAIIQSPWMFGYVTRLAEPSFVFLDQPVANAPSSEALGLSWAQEIAGDGDSAAIDALRAMPWRVFFDGRPYYKTRPTIDGWLLPDLPETAFQHGRQHDVPLLIGTNKDEGNFFRPFFPYESRETVAQLLHDYYGEAVDSVLDMYPGESATELADAVSQYVTDAWFLLSTRQMLQGMQQVSSPAFQYRFSRRSQLYPQLGSPHAMEIRYVFNALTGEHIKPEDELIAATMMRYWVQFARQGNPNDGELPYWPEFSAQDEAFLDISEEIVVGSHFRSETLRALDQATAPARVP
jgi:para-nitrobenzyl esterase